MTELTRRRLVQVGTGGIATALAGCNSPNDDTDDAVDDGNGSVDASEPVGDGAEPAAADDRTVTVFTSADQEAVTEAQQAAQERQQEIQQAQQEGELTQEEAQEQLQELQMDFQETQAELRSEAVDAVVTTVGDTSGLAVEDSVPESALVLVAGEPGALIDLLPMSQVAGLLEESRFEEIQQQQP